jgi:hypothetical protein
MSFTGECGNYSRTIFFAGPLVCFIVINVCSYSHKSSLRFQTRF